MANVIKRIVVEKLYDNYDYDITLQAGGVSLLTGPNGYGKTTILNIIKNVMDLNLWYFHELLFQKITVYFNSGKDSVGLHIEKKYKKRKSIFADIDSQGDTEHYELVRFYIGNKVVSKVKLDNERLDMMNSRPYYTYSDILEREERNMLAHSLSRKDRMDYLERIRFKQEMPDLNTFVAGYNCLFIREQRILATSTNGKRSDEDDDESSKYTITHLAQQICRMYAEEKSKYTDKSQQIDSSFMDRLIKESHKKSTKKYSEEEYNERLRALQKIVDEYKQYGLLSNYSIVGEYSNDLKLVSSLYLDDMFRKIGSYDSFFRKLSLFNRFVNGKGLSNKHMVLDEKFGISFKSDSGRDVPLHKLSSGEQNLIILYYRLVFETKPNTLLLIDEPENSLHVEWLQKMLPDYLVMETELKCQMIIATHSITFINGHWNIAYDLDGGSYQA